ncbi:MAG TPA: hypothetical protein VHI78_00400 [Bacteroidales bacterium]|nr:hypothetical protein [Bacteroidales bacterium]
MEPLKSRSLFNPGGCLTAATFNRYLENTLRPAEKVRVEDHLRHCLICSEALEGYKRHQSKTFMKSDLEFLSVRIKKRYSSRQWNKGLPVSILISLFIFMIILFIIFFIIRYFLLNP